MSGSLIIEFVGIFFIFRFFLYFIVEFVDFEYEAPNSTYYLVNVNGSNVQLPVVFFSLLS